MSKQSEALMQHPEPVMRALGLVLFELEGVKTQVETVSGRLDAMVKVVEQARKDRLNGDESLGRSLDRMWQEIGAVARAQGAQAGRVAAICTHLNIKPSVHEASEPIPRPAERTPAAKL